MPKLKKKKTQGSSKPASSEKSRKLLRKEHRLQKKQRRATYFAKRAERSKKNVHSEAAQPKAGSAHDGGRNVGGQTSKKTSQDQEALQKIEKEHAEKRKLEADMAKQRRIQLLEANKEEDRNISRLEKLLKLDRRKRKTIPRSFYEDNLGSVLEVCDRDYLKQLAQTEKTIQDSGSEFEDDFATVTGKKRDRKTNKEDRASPEPTNHKNYSGDADSGDSLSDEDDMSIDAEPSMKKRAVEKPKKSTSKQIKSESEESADDDEVYSDLDGSDHFDDSDFGLGMDDGSGSDDDSINNDSDDLEELNSSDNEESQSMERPPREEIGKKRVRFSSSCSDDDKTKKHKTTSCATDTADNRNKSHKQDSKLSTQKSSKNVKMNVKGTNPEKALPKKSADTLVDKNGDSSDEDSDDYGDSNDDDDDICDDSDDELDERASGAAKVNPDGTWEDIYGRLRSSSGDVVQKSGKYVPPALRGDTSDSKKKELDRLRRQMKGLINRLAENNLASISSQLDEMYMTNSRHDMNETLTQLMLEALVSMTSTPDRLVMEHCLLIGLLHANVGSEVGAHFLQVVVKKFDELLSKDVEVDDKQVDNLALIISHLYNFKIFSASLIFSVLDRVAQRLNEKRIDLLLLILRTVGSTLRKDDPVSLKTLVIKLQASAAGTPELQTNSRVKFMLEVLLAIKNNNMSKIPNYSHENVDHAKKLLRSLIRRGKYVTELNISLDDLLKADERGRWWIVGSAWTGHLPGESSGDPTKNSKLTVAQSSESFNAELLELARKQRMNTDTRRNIFCILLTAEDYLDAFEKLLHLNLKNQQEQEIIHVLLHCALQEKNYNPYYAHLAQKFCDFDRKYQMKIQYSVWDKLKDLASLESFQISNLARLLAHLFLEKGLPISVLKVISFAEISKPGVRLIRQILLNILMIEDRSESEAVFLRVAPSPKLRLFREGLRLFIRHFMLRPSNTKALSEEELALLEDRAAMAERALSAAEKELAF